MGLRASTRPIIVPRRTKDADTVRFRRVRRPFVSGEDETESAVRTWGGQHAALSAALAAAERAVEVVVVGRGPMRPAAAGRVLEEWAATPPEAVMLSHQGAASELAAIKKAIATSDWPARETYVGLNPAIQRARVLRAACAGDRRSRVAIRTGRTWRSTRMPEWIPTGRADAAA